ncbi:MAG: SDR family oxidoreductase [Candidatus Promineifilaceae bacterium]|nr:SDR family oxidoreductase [Candidatus Promineifilaceae bacterium]
MYDSIYKTGLFAGKNFLITGGGTGIGRAIAHELAALGGRVLLAARNLQRLQETAQEIRDSGGRAASYQLNIRDPIWVEEVVDQIVRDYETIDGLVNNAGGQFPSPAEHISPKGWHAVIETNLTGTFNMCRAVFNLALPADGGAIVNIVAEMWNGFPGMAHTGAARAGVVNLTKTLAVEWAAKHVRVNAVAPGIIAGHGIRQYTPEIRRMIEENISRDIPAKRLGTESEVAAAVTFLLSPVAAYITGETIRVDGGSSLRRSLWGSQDYPDFDAYDGFTD